MKRIILELVLASACCIMYATEPIFSPDTEWHYRETNMFDGTSTVRTYGIRDSSYNNTTYKCIQGAILRTEGAKVWCVVDSMGKQVEQLLYDFDLMVGDSIRTISYPMYDPELPPHFAKVTQVETIVLSDGRTARHLIYDSRVDDIEHIGCVTGILHAAVLLLPPDGIIEDFVCCTRGDNLLYETSNGACGKLIQGINNIHHTSSATKILRDGQLLIRRGDKSYTATGQETIAPPAKK